jgi:hypothetical protein
VLDAGAEGHIAIGFVPMFHKSYVEPGCATIMQCRSCPPSSEDQGWSMPLAAPCAECLGLGPRASVGMHELEQSPRDGRPLIRGF